MFRQGRMGRITASLAQLARARQLTPPARRPGMNSRIAIRGLTIALLGAGLALPGGALAGNGGTAPPQPAADGPVDPAFALSAKHTVFLGKTLHVAGNDSN